MGSHQPIRKTVTHASGSPEIPDKLYFRIGDVARLCEVPAYVLRFWETEFPQLKPNKGGTGQRLYRKRDVEMALRIKSLLYDQGYTIPGARQVFKAETRVPDGKAPDTKTPEAKAPEAKTSEAKGLELRARETPFGGASPQTAGGASVASSPHVVGSLQEADSAEEAGGQTLSGMRRDAKLNEIRSELAGLLSMLSKPASGVSREAKVQTMRPRLTLESSRTRQLSLDGELF